MSNNGWSNSGSPFHRGEVALQERSGVRERMESFGKRVIRDHMPEQHRDFYAQLPMVIVGHVDDKGRPWCSLVPGKPGFATSPNNRQLNIETEFLAGDPIAANLRPGDQFGLLGIELQSRRRNRLNGSVAANNGTRLTLSVDQAFGNCPQYIQTRAFHFADAKSLPAADQPAESFTALSEELKLLVGNADTFFVSSQAPVEDDGQVQGIDASHRGGRPGFVRVDDDWTLTVPDYLGNFHFNTLGNFLVNPRAGLLFSNFETGDVVMLTGTVEIVWDSDEVIAFQGAERIWRFRLEAGLMLRGASPLRWSFGEYSPNSLLTGTWSEAEARVAADRARNHWQPYRVVHMVNESDVIRSFYLEPEDGSAIAPFEAGQFLTLRLTPDETGKKVIRTYTVSSAPGDPIYRISVKREAAPDEQTPAGLASNYLHEQIKVGDSIEAKAPQGKFTWNAEESRPAVLISAGVGITPMISMLKRAVHEGIRTRRFRPVTFIHGARNGEQRAFLGEASELAKQTSGAARIFWAFSRPGKQDQAGRDYHLEGRITADFLREVLALDDYDFYLCGPSGFMQSMYDDLRSLGVQDRRIQAESFGPAALTRRPDTATPMQTTLAEASDALVSFTQSDFEMPWTSEDGTLLELAEAHGLAPEFGCRNGVCGTCVTQVESGKVAYRTPPAADPGEGKALICCAVPARPEKGEALLKLKL